MEALVGVLWDIGLEIGHSVRTIAECQDEARRDVTVQTTLLESRLVAGSRKQYTRFASAIIKDLDVAYFVEAKLIEPSNNDSTPRVSTIPPITSRPNYKVEAPRPT